MFPTASPWADLSRLRLRTMGLWIRDELDPILARDGPEQLRPDDVLTLHDFFLALRTSQTITALDLRATGIHRAVLDVSGIATRWPGRLADDCDKVISAWTAKFGRLDELRPFLYGRGGRLEGIAAVGDDSNEKLIKRWEAQCPEKIAPARSHQHGDLGFRAGAWWISPLFAYHAGIIGLESIEGGITYDKDAAYALLLMEPGESQDPVERAFTFSFGQNDKGRYRLANATPKSRGDQGRIRVLRSHHINSIWGPKAGVRYEGLYRVAGWTIKSVKSSDKAKQENRFGDVVYDIHFERDDPVPMSEVMKMPTTFQVDEYTEYKRLRKVHRDSRRVVKVAPPIQPTAHPSPQTISTQHSAQARPSPSPSQNPTFKRPIKFLENKLSPKPFGRMSMKRTVSPLPSVDHINDDLILGPPKSELGNNFNAHDQTDQSTMPPKFGKLELKRSESIHSGTLVATASNGESSHSQRNDMREVAPWIDSEGPPAALQPSEISPPAMVKKELFTVKSFRWRGHGLREDDVNPKSRGKRTLSTAHGWLKKSESISKSPISKLVDGTEDTESEDDPAGNESRDWQRSSGSISPYSRAVSKGGREEKSRASSSGGHLPSPTAIRVARPLLLRLRKSGSEESTHVDQDGDENVFADVTQYDGLENSPSGLFPPPKPSFSIPLLDKGLESAILHSPTRSSAYLLSGFTPLKSRPVVGGEMRAETAVHAGGEGVKWVKGVSLGGLSPASESLKRALGVDEGGSDRDAGGKLE